MDTSIIEKIATNIVERETLKYPECLNPYVNSNDRTPVWDGHVYIYSSSNHTIDNLEGKIEVQIKGRKVNKLSKGNAKFSISVSQLKAYKKSLAGTLLILVEFTDIEHFQMYYVNLLPVDLCEIFDSIAENQESKTLTLKPIVPKSSSSLKFVCLNFLENSNKQANRRCISESEMSDIEKISFKVINAKKGFEEYILNNGVYTYGIMKGTGEIVNLPILRDVKLYETLKIPVILDEEEVNIDITKTKDSYGEKFIISKSMQLDKKTCKFVYKVAGNLNERIRDLKLLLFILTNSKIVTKKGELSIPFNDDKITENRVHIKELLDKYVETKEVLKYFNIDNIENMDKFSDKDLENLQLLINLYKGKNLDLLSEYRTYCISFSNIKVFILPKIESGVVVGIYNLFESMYGKIKFYLLGEKGKQIDISLYCTLDKLMIINASNFNASVILEDIKRYSLSNESCVNYNQLILNLISAYDETDNEIYLQLSFDIQEYILTFVKDDVYLLNYYQIIYRKKGLSKDDKMIIKEIYDRGNNFIKYGAAKLLNNVTDYEMAYSLLTPTEKEHVNNYPIINVN